MSRERSNGRTAAASNFRGEEGRRRMLDEQRKQEERKEAQKLSMNAPNRLRLSPGETREVVIVDEAPDFFRYEHNMKGPDGYWNVFTGCVNETANCPVCSATGKQANFCMYLTVIDLTPYTNSAGDEVEFSKRLMVVKSAQQKKIMRLFERHETLRGMVVSLTRDGDKDAQIGNDIEFVEFLDEDTLESYVYEYTDREKKTHEVLCYEPYEYDELFPEPTEKQLRAIVGGRSEPGSRDDDDKPAARGARGARGSTTANRGRRGGSSSDDDSGGDDGWGSGSSTRRRPSAPNRSAKDDDQPWSDDDKQAEDKAPARRRPAARQQEDAKEESKAPARRGRRA